LRAQCDTRTRCGARDVRDAHTVWRERRPLGDMPETRTPYGATRVNSLTAWMPSVS
jgi:hypothetical protein